AAPGLVLAEVAGRVHERARLRRPLEVSLRQAEVPEGIQRDAADHHVAGAAVGLAFAAAVEDAHVVLQPTARRAAAEHHAQVAALAEGGRGDVAVDEGLPARRFQLLAVIARLELAEAEADVR